MSFVTACRASIVLAWPFPLLVFVTACSGPDAAPPTPAAEQTDAPVADEPAPGTDHVFSLFGGTIERNMANGTEKNISDSWSVKKGKEKNVKWKAALGSKAYGGPVIAGGRIFVGTNQAHGDKQATPKGVMLCIRESDGRFLWQLVHDKLDDQGIDVPEEGLASSPAVEDGRLYYVSNRCELVCADAKGDPDSGIGKIIWSLDMIKDLKVYPGGLAGGLANCSPLILDDLVFVVTSNGRDGMGKLPAPEAPSFLAVNKATGKPVWHSNLPGDGILDGQWGNPCAAEVNGKKQVIFPGGDGWLYAFEPETGTLLWKFDCNPKDSSFKKGTRNYLVSTPVVNEGKLYVGVGREPSASAGGVGHLWCIDIAKEPKNKEKDLSPVKDNFDPKDPVNKDSGLVWHIGGKVSPEPKDDSRDVVFGRTISTAAVHDGIVYTADIDGFVYCLDAATGKKYWEYDLGGSVWASPYYVDGKIYLGTGSGEVFIFAAEKEKKEPAKLKMESGEEILAPLAAAHGVLYINTGSMLYAIATK
jgi:outer membrane protein assembly factor BamB